MSNVYSIQVIVDKSHEDGFYFAVGYSPHKPNEPAYSCHGIARGEMRAIAFALQDIAKSLLEHYPPEYPTVDHLTGLKQV